MKFLAFLFASSFLVQWGHCEQGDTKYFPPQGQSLRQKPVFIQENEYVVKAIVLPERKKQSRQNFENLFSAVDFIEGFEKRNVHLELMESAKTFDRSWDLKDRRIRNTLHQEYLREEEVAYTLSQRRALEHFLHHDSETEVALMLEADSTYVSISILDEIDDLLSKAPKGWDFIQLGRCSDLWCHEEQENNHVANFGGNGKNGEIGLQKGRGFELCSHAYLVTRKGAEKILQYSLPVLLPYDHTLMLLSREGILQEYFTSPRMFVQSNDSTSSVNHETSETPECDSTGKDRAEHVFEQLEIYDPYMISRILHSPTHNMISLETRRLANAPSPALAELGRSQIMENLCEGGHTKFCPDEPQGSQIIQHCHFVGGSSSTGEIPDEASESLLQRLDEADLDGVIIWGLRPDQENSHRHVHMAISTAVEEALKFSNRQLHVCYVNETPDFDLGKDLYGDSSRGKLGRSLIFASPKHMTRSNDPGFLMLPVESTSRYIFHGETPRAHTVLKREGFAAEWETWGPDGIVPIIDSDAFVRGEVSKDSEGCLVDKKRKTFICPDKGVIVQPWGSEYTPNQILSNKDRAFDAYSEDAATTLHFVGDIWSCNVEEFIAFTEGCADYGIRVIHHGEMLLPTDDGKIDELTSLPNFSAESLAGHSSDELFRSEQGAVYGPAFQGSCHFEKNPSDSYIEERILNMISIGVYPLTNNPSSYELLGESGAIVFDRDTTNLCRSMVEHQSPSGSLTSLMEKVAQHHTYASRLTKVLDFLSNPNSMNVQEESEDDRDNFMYLLDQASEYGITSARRRTKMVSGGRMRLRGALGKGSGNGNGNGTNHAVNRMHIQEELNEMLHRNNVLREASPLSLRLTESPSASPTDDPYNGYDINFPRIDPSPSPPVDVETDAPSPVPSSMASVAPTDSVVTPPPDLPDETESADMSLSLSMSFSLILREIDFHDIELRDNFFLFDEESSPEKRQTSHNHRKIKRPQEDEHLGERLEVTRGRRRRLIRIREDEPRPQQKDFIF